MAKKPTYRAERTITVDPRDIGIKTTISTDQGPSGRERGVAGLYEVAVVNNHFATAEYERGDIVVSWTVFETVNGVERELSAEEVSQLLSYHWASIGPTSNDRV